MANSPQITPSINSSFNNYAHLNTKGKPIELNQVSLSQLLGRDYLFIDFSERAAPQEEKDFYDAIEILFEDLGLSPNETLVVGVVLGLDGNAFTRYELTWLSNKIRRHEVVEIKSSEQNAFMQMIWQCTSPIPAY